MFLLTIILAFCIQAFGISECTKNQPVHSKCTIEIVKLKPTQFALGMYEVHERVKKFEKLSDKELEEYLNDNLIPVADAPESALYVLDHHHLLRVLLDLNHRYATVQIEANFNGLSQDDFWKKMGENGWYFLYDESGKKVELKKEQLPSDILPKQIRDLKDDPYRSLSWLVRKNGGYKKTKVLFAEFLWAQYFRKSLTLGNNNESIERALPAALRLARSKDAKDLPGYLEP